MLQSEHLLEDNPPYEWERLSVCRLVGRLVGHYILKSAGSYTSMLLSGALAHLSGVLSNIKYSITLILLLVYLFLFLFVYFKV